MFMALAVADTSSHTHTTHILAKAHNHILNVLQTMQDLGLELGSHLASDLGCVAVEVVLAIRVMCKNFHFH